MTITEETPVRFGTRCITALSRYRIVLCLGIVAGFAELAFAVINQSALPPFVQELGLTAHIGLFYSAFLVVETAFKSPMGALGDRIGRRPTIVLGCILSGASTLAMVFTHKLWMLTALCALNGLGAAAVWPTVVAAMSGSVCADRRTTAMSVLTVTYIGGVAVGPLIGGLANDLTGTKTASLYLVTGLFVVAALVAVFLTPHRSQEEEEEHAEGAKLSLRDLAAGLRTIPDMMLLAFFAFFGIGLLIPIVKLFAMNELHMSETRFGGVILPVAVVVGLASLVSGRLGDRWGKAVSVHLGVGLCAVSMWTISMAHHYLEFAGAAMVLGVGFVLAMPAWLALVSDMACARMRGGVIGALGTAQGIGAVLGAYLGSQFYQKLDINLWGLQIPHARSPFIISALALTLCFLLSLIFIRKGEARRLG